MGNALFYRELGKLLFAIASADETITEQERAAVSKLIAERLLHKEKDTDRFGTNEAWITQFAFDTEADGFRTAEEAFESFLDFAKSYKNELTDQDLDVCISLSEHMADAYRHVNQKEHKMLKELQDFLKKINGPNLIF
jgi:uncharacterized tellurite resistance protein B-like protein